MTVKPKVLIVGAGIGGLTAAIVLRQAGFEIEVFERAAEVKEVGAGIGLSANATRVLKHLGLIQQVAKRGTIIEAIECRNSRGSIISQLPMANLTDAPGICLHRADLQQVLQSALPLDCIRLGEEFVKFDQT